MSVLKNLFKAEWRLHVTFFERLWKSSDLFPVKILKLGFYLEFLAPSRYLSANNWVPYLAAPVTVIYLLVLKSPDCPSWLFWFIVYHYILMMEGSVVCVSLYFFPSLKKTLDDFVYGPDMTFGFLGNPNTKTLSGLAIGIATMGATAGVWHAEGQAATVEVAQQIKTYKALHPNTPDISFDTFQEKIGQKVRTYPLHSASELVDIQISLKKQGGGFASSGLQK
jgi:hypothetical protein